MPNYPQKSLEVPLEFVMDSVLLEITYNERLVHLGLTRKFLNAFFFGLFCQQRLQEELSDNLDMLLGDSLKEMKELKHTFWTNVTRIVQFNANFPWEF